MLGLQVWLTWISDQTPPHKLVPAVNKYTYRLSNINKRNRIATQMSVDREQSSVVTWRTTRQNMQVDPQNTLFSIKNKVGSHEDVAKCLLTAVTGYFSSRQVLQWRYMWGAIWLAWWVAHCPRWGDRCEMRGESIMELLEQGLGGRACSATDSNHTCMT